MNWTGRVLALLATLALGLGVAACGSDSDSDSPSTGDTAAQSADTSPGNDTAETGEATEVEGVEWQLMNIATQGSASSLPNTVDAPTLEFENGEVSVFSGCNSGSGKAEVGEETIDFGPVMLTKKACAGLAGEVEGYVTQVLKGEVGYEINQGNLILEGDQFSLVFTAA